jgi:hypothetical protein
MRSEVITLVAGVLQKRPEIIFAYVFGSVTESDSFRDIDVGVYVDQTTEMGDNFEYAMKLGRALEASLGISVDVILMNTAPDHLIHNISKGDLIVTRDEDRRVSFITNSWSKYFDFEPKRRQWLREVLEA